MSQIYQNSFNFNIIKSILNNIIALYNNFIIKLKYGFVSDDVKEEDMEYLTISSHFIENSEIFNTERQTNVDIFTKNIELRNNSNYYIPPKQ